MTTKLPLPEYDKRLNNFYYAQQFKKYVLQFMAIFTDLKVQIGKNDSNSSSNFITVPVHYGSMDRVVASIMAGNTQNKLFRVPAMAAKIISIDMAPEAYKGMGQKDRKTQLKRGQKFPEGIEVVHRLVPIPFNIDFELSIIASSTDQMFQMLEQILILFDPILQIQTSDAPTDWTKINKVELTGMSLDENYPANTDPRNIAITLNFSTIIYLSAPENIKKNVIQQIMLRIATIPTTANTQEEANDVDKLLPEYEALFDIDKYDLPEN